MRVRVPICPPRVLFHSIKSGDRWGFPGLHVRVFAQMQLGTAQPPERQSTSSPPGSCKRWRSTPRVTIEIDQFNRSIALQMWLRRSNESFVGPICGVLR